MPPTTDAEWNTTKSDGTTKQSILSPLPPTTDDFDYESHSKTITKQSILSQLPPTTDDFDYERLRSPFSRCLKMLIKPMKKQHLEHMALPGPFLDTQVAPHVPHVPPSRPQKPTAAAFIAAEAV